MSTREITGASPIGDPRRHPGSPPRQGEAARERQKRRTGEAERRRHERIAGLGLQIVIGGKRYAVADLSLGGLRAAPYDGPLRVGERFEFGLRMMVQGCITSFRGRAAALRRDRDALIAVFKEDQPYFYQTLCHYIEQERHLRLSYGADPHKGVPRPAFVAKSV
jgi:hypothetical protein